MLNAPVFMNIIHLDDGINTKVLKNTTNLPSGPMQRGGSQVTSRFINSSTLRDEIFHQLYSVIDGCPVHKCDIIIVSRINIKTRFNQLLASL